MLDEEVATATDPALTLESQNVYFRIAQGQVSLAVDTESNEVLSYDDPQQPANSDAKFIAINVSGISYGSRYDNPYFTICIFVYEDTAQPYIADAKCLIQNAEVHRFLFPR